MTAATLPHQPVMRERIVSLFETAPEGVIVDATLGAAGHASAIVAARTQRYGHATLVGIDQDPTALELARERLATLMADERTTVIFHKARFDAIDEVLDAYDIDVIAGILFDLGVSSMHLDQAERGFSYRQDADLDMRMDPELVESAGTLVNTASEEELARILREYGDERFARRIARSIVEHRPVTRTVALAELIREAIPAAARRTGGHPATRSFQALRIAVNGELEALEQALPRALKRLAPGGVMAVLSYHSLEDQLVKRAFTTATTGCVCPPKLPVCACGKTAEFGLVTRKVERPDNAEIAANPRASAARFRAIRRNVSTDDAYTAAHHSTPKRP
ncbi:MAG: 16S rRNA (cytosine(1402)-N(4))-methyltransferase RsmH [Nitriliruptoraceae bacterium]